MRKESIPELYADHVTSIGVSAIPSAILGELLTVVV